MNKSRTSNFKYILVFILSMLSKFKLNVLIMLLIALVVAIDLSFRKYLVKDILDTAVKYQEGNVIENLLLPVSAYIFMALLITTAFRFYGYFVDIRMFTSLREKIADMSFYRLLQQDHSYYQDNLSGSLVHKASNLMDSVIELIRLFIDCFFSYSIALILAIYTLSLVNIKFAIATFTWVSIFTLISIFSFRTLTGLADNHSQQSSQVIASIADSILNIISIRLFSQKAYERRKFSYICKKKTFSERKLQWAYFWLWLVYGYSFDLLQAVSLYFLIHDYQLNKIAIGDIALVLGINISIIEFLNHLTRNLAQFSAHYGKVLDALPILITIPEIQDKQNAKRLTVVSGKIIFNNVDFSYEDKEPLFQNFSVTINPYEKVGLVGYSGGGKSTFISLILRLFDVKKGNIQIDNQVVSEVTQSSLRQQISVVPQDPLLFHDTISANIMYGNPLSTNEEVIKAAKLAGIHDFIMTLPDHYKTTVGEKGIKLSGGERQRIVIARAFLKNAPILFLDEPTSQLDSITEKTIQMGLFKLMENKTTITIAHRISTLLHMDRILVFDKGKIVQDGKHIELVSKQGLYKELWDAQIGCLYIKENNEKNY
ncbi:ABC transporter ATP-binding protein [Wolbachia endosymbiont of Folsomia candida]|uniref:ABC transporter ATP-binding protein n=1 Tax=Wolbachia endosymbiont of Folsomia candida TaxID=169402 RepID=UPI000AE73BDD|nr:ABC transporter ATP-binding protein [Wolbachia endosymbiont of Folsomia candida]APR97858.1 ABC transporter ATP-binding protein [Wolbachia endosymbiont of Folsomia candida]